MAASCIVALLADEAVSAQTVSRFTWNFDQAVAMFHQGLLADGGGYLFLDGVNLWMRRSDGRKRVQMFVAYDILADVTRRLLAFTNSAGRVRPRETVCFMNSIGDGLNDGTSG